jgi:hypothetical protein
MLQQAPAKLANLAKAGLVFSSLIFFVIYYTGFF